MRKVLGKWVLSLVVCSVAFGMGHGVIRWASGEGDDGGGTVATATAIPDSDSTVAPEATATSNPLPAQTAAPTGEPSPRRIPGVPSIEEMGARVQGGHSYELEGVRLHFPEGFGDYVVIYPVLVDYGPENPEAAEEGNIIATIYNIQTKSSLFLSIADRSGHPRAKEVGRHTVSLDAGPALGPIASDAEVLAR